MQRKILIPLGLIATIFFLWFIIGGDSEERVELLTSPVKGEFVVDVTTTGELRAKNSTEIKGPRGAREFRVNNIRIQRLVAEGTIVKKGDFVAELDRSEIMGKLQDAQLDVEQAQSQVTQAQLDSTLELSQARDNLINLNYALEERQIELDQSKYESPAVQRQAEIELDKARRQLAQETRNYETKVKQAEAKLREVETELTKKKNEIVKINELMKQFTVYAPEQGMVIYRRNWDGSKITEGEQISTWNPTVAELPDFTIMESVTYINEVDIQKVEVGQKVNIGLDAVPDKQLTGEVTSVANIGEQRKNYDSKVFEVTIVINESDSLLRPAMTTSNQVIIDRIPDVISVPLEAIHAVDSLSFVIKKDGLNPVMHQVELGLMNDNSVIVHRGVLLEDELYISVPEDMADLRKVMLNEEITQKGN